MTDTEPRAPAPEMFLDEEIDLRESLRLVFKHYKLMNTIVAAAMIAAFTYCLMAPKIWQAQATVEVPDSKADNPLNKLSVLVATSDRMETYQEIARSANVARRAAVAVGLTASPEYAEETDLEAATAKLKKRITVSTVKDSTILLIQVRSTERKLAASLADAVAQAFIDANLDFSKKGARSRRQFVESQVIQVKSQLNMDEDLLQKFSSRNKSLAGPANNSQGSAAIDPLIKLKSEILDLKVERGELANRFSPEHPRIRNLDAQISAAQAQYDHEMSKLPSDTMDYNRLARDVKVGEGVYTLLLEKLQEARIDENADDTDIVVVDGAQTPVQPVAPQRLAILAVTLGLSILGAFGIAALVEYFRDEVKGEDELARRTKLPVLAVIPDWRETKDATILRIKNGPKKIHDPSYLIHQSYFQHNYYSEASKILRTNLKFSGFEKNRKTVSLMSASRQEGKTLCNANLAIAFAQTGKKILFCDADLRKPSVHKIFDIPATNYQGLPLLISGQGSVDGMVVKGPLDNLWLLPCGVKVPNPSELLGSEDLEPVIKSLREKFDYIVFDSGPGSARDR